ncbi:MAG: TRAP transporter small permease [Alphaproteobacteria bacterium]
MDSFIARFRDWAQRLANAAQALLLVGVLITIADIALRPIANTAIPGTVDMMQLFVMWSALLAIPAAFLTDEHVAIDLFTKSLPLAVQRALRLMATLMGVAVLVLLAWYGAQQGWHEHAAGDSTQTLGLPIGLYWIPLLFGLALSALACLALALEAAWQLFSGRGAAPMPPARSEL